MDNHSYDDIINLPNLTSKNHPRMSLHDRAAQFAPFAALTGHDAAIKETARLTDERLELSDEIIMKLNDQLNMIRDNIGTEQEVSITYFVPDDKKAGGLYVTHSSVVKNIRGTNGRGTFAFNDAANQYTGLKKKVLKNKGEIYKLNPYKLLWYGDYYYVLGYSEKKSKVINFRVDRIASKPEILDKDIIPMPDDFDIENCTKEVFFMFSGEKVLVDLRCDNSLMKTMVDRFGEDVTTLAYDMTSFRVQTDDCTSR